MQLSDKVKKQILINILKVIKRISDKEYQKRVWILGEGPEVDDFDETCCNLFDDYDCNSIIENYKDFEITEPQKKLLKKFRDKFRTFSDENFWPPEFIDTPEWAKITEMAEDVLKSFSHPKTC